ncbi:MAG: 2,3-bisphosphoglycerate-dependent phosphoglycerate mutase [Chlamydiota bacterium]
MTNLILLRHGQSVFNKKNLFTGWVDVPLSPQGIEEARSAGAFLQNYTIDVVYVSDLIRALMTTFLVLSVRGEECLPILFDEKQGPWSSLHAKELTGKFLPVYRDARLNERMYGELQGKDKQQVRDEFGQEQVHLWRRSYDTPPPGGESLEDNTKRTIPYFLETVLPRLEAGDNVLIVAHGNSLRAIIKWLKGLSAEEIVQVEIPTGKPLIYSYNAGSFVEKEL